MSNRYAQIGLLAEDERSANLMRRYVQRALGIGPRRVRELISPSGGGDAKHWVIGRYPVEVRELRRKLSHRGLVVHLDADTETVQRRSDQLAMALASDGQDSRSASERISHAIPRRQTETWLCALTGIPVNEDQDCKRQGLPRDPDKTVRPAAESLYALTRQNAAPPTLPSLVLVVPELQRLEPE